MKRYSNLSILNKYNFFIGLINTILIFIVNTEFFGEFSGYAYFLALYSKSKFIVLDDCNLFKQHNVLSFIEENRANFELIYDSENRGGVKFSTILKVNKKT